MRRPRRNHVAVFKAKVAIAALKGDETLAALAEKFDVHPNLITQWKTLLLENAHGVFSTVADTQASGPDLKDLHAKIGQQSLEIDFLAVALGRFKVASGKTMIDARDELSIVKQASVLGLSHSMIYYLPVATPEADLRLMRWIDELHLEHPFADARMLRDMLMLEGIEVGRRHVTLMKKMGIEALCRKTNTSRHNQTYRIYPYPLRHHTIDHPSQVRDMDTTYIPMQRGFVYLTAVQDWATRCVLAWPLSNTLTADPCVEALEEAPLKYGAKEIMNTDQGSQFNSHQLSLHRRTRAERHQDLHGWQRPLARQCRCRTALEIGEIRRGLPTCLRYRFHRPAGIGQVFQLLRLPPSVFNRYLRNPDTAYFTIRHPPLASAA